MNIKRFVIACAAAFITVVLFEMLWHGFLMKDMYQATSSVWRPEDECDMRFMFLGQVLFAGVLTYIYTVIGKHLSCKRGIAYGLFSGLLLGVPQLGAYCYLPIPLTISLMWVVASVLKCVFASMAIAAIYKFED